MEIFTKSAQDTQKLGQKIGNNLTNENLSSNATILALFGELGSGKTTFIQGLTKSLSLPHRIISPTFIIMKRYQVAKGNFKFLYHLDLYRLQKVDFDELGLSEIFADPDNLVVIEWADRLKNDLPKICTKIYFEIISENNRKIIIN